MDIREGSLAEALAVHNEVPELRPLQSQNDYLQRIGDRDFLLLVGCAQRRPVAFKLGFWLDKAVFYSWVGGVAPEYRRAGPGGRAVVVPSRYYHSTWVLYTLGGACSHNADHIVELAKNI